MLFTLVSNADSMPALELRICMSKSLPEVMSYLHERGVRGYVTLNTLIFPSELETVERHIVQLTEAGVDAVLVQDLGLVRLLRMVSPDLAVHASTQMTLTSAECIRAAEELGIERVVLARELSIDEIREIRTHTTAELEVFVHGALCVAYSGQCLTSESLGGRSANRGQCAQACRLPYDLICDGRDVDLGDVKYLLSPQDLAAYELVPELIAAGVSSFKIEGRLKTPEYVANITRHYRRALDAAAAGQYAVFTDQDVTEMELSFSRGFSPGWLGGCDHKMLVPGLSSAKRGVLLGEVKSVRANTVIVTARRAIAPGDGVVFAGNREKGDEQGGRVYEVTPRGKNEIELAFGHNAIDFARIEPGQQLWKTDDPQLTSKLRKSFQGGKTQRRVGLNVTVHAAVGEVLQITASSDNGASCKVESAEPLAAAKKHPLTNEVLEQQLGRLGNTVYSLRNLQSQIVGEPMAPLSVLGDLRHKMIDALASLQIAGTATSKWKPIVLELSRDLDSARRWNQIARTQCFMPNARAVGSRGRGWYRVFSSPTFKIFGSIAMPLKSRSGMAPWYILPRRAFKNRAKPAFFALWPNMARAASSSAIWPAWSFAGSKTFRSSAISRLMPPTNGQSTICFPVAPSVSRCLTI